MKRVLASVMVLSALLLSACSSDNKELTAAPLGDKAILQKLADAWDDVSEEKVSISPTGLPADKRRKFLGEVFTAAGYDYTKTLHAMATKGIDKTNTLHKDMAELILMPHRNQRGGSMDPADIYSMDELKDIAALERMLK